MNNPNNPDENKGADQTESEASKSEDAVETDVVDADSQEADLSEASETQDDTMTSGASNDTLEGGAADDTLAEEPVDSDPDTSRTSDHSNDDHYADESQGGGGFAATALKLLLLVLFIFGLSLWLVPMVAPHLPDGIAKRVMPGQAVLDERLAALEASATETKSTAEEAQAAALGIADMQQEIATLKDRLAAAEEATEAAKSAADAAREAAASGGTATGSGDSEAVASAAAAAAEAAETSKTATAAATEAGKVASAAMRDTASLARQMTSFEARLANLKSEIQAIGDNLASAATQEGGASTAEISAAFAALKARVDALAQAEPDLSAYIRRDESDGFVTHDDLRSARTALSADMDAAIDALPEAGVLATTNEISELRGSVEGQVSALSDQIGQIGEKADAAMTAAMQAEASAGEAVGTVAGAIRGASVEAATAALLSRMSNGRPFAGALDEVTQLTGTTAPDALTAVAATGVRTTEALTRQFKPLAQKAIAADLQALTGGDALGQASARLQSIFAGRPKNEQPGEGAGAILSRVEARLADGDVASALAEAETLSDAAQSGLGGWLGDLRARVAADVAVEAFLSDVSASQG